jgi:triacylglycerol lipase
MSLLAYVEEEARVREVLARAGFARARLFERGIARAIVAPAEGFAVVAFRGTRPGVLADLLADADLRLVRWEGAGRVHAGFAAALRRFESFPAGRVWFTGHSLGGALATLAHARAPGAGLVTFGAPRVGDREFAAAFPGRAWRVVNNNDFVPRLPPPPYRHVGRLRYFDRRGRLLAAPPPAVRLADRLRGHADRVLDAFARLSRGETAGIAFDPLVDHSPLLYATLCWNACAGTRAP